MEQLYWVMFWGTFCGILSAYSFMGTLLSFLNWLRDRKNAQRINSDFMEYSLKVRKKKDNDTTPGET